MGGIQSHEMDVLASKIWQWCIDRKIWISCNHVVGDSNKADFASVWTHLLINEKGGNK
jgi:hypothetical protein